MPKYYLLYIVFLFLFAAGCSKAGWHQDIDKLTPDEIDNVVLSTHDDIAYHLDLRKPFLKDREAAFRVLLNTAEFADCCVGINGMPSPQVIAYHVLMEQPDRELIYLDLIERANPEGRLYALIALFKIDYSLFVKKIQPALRDTTKIQSMSGCIISSSNFHQALVSEETEQRLLQGQPVVAWLKQNPPSKRDFEINPMGLESDVINGGLAENFDYIKEYALAQGR